MVLAGKEGPKFMKGVYANLGRPSAKVIVGPGWGLDNAVVSVGHGRVMIITVDPVSIIPEFGMKLSGWLSVHLIASDYTASGADPEFATFSYNFPPAISVSEKEEFIRGIGSECKRLGISIVGGNTGSYPGAGFTVVGTGSMFGLASASRYVTPTMARPGDAVLMTKHAAIEATGSLALSFPSLLVKKVGKRTASLARSIIHSCSTVEDARSARRVGLGKDSVTSMHDATEGGVLGGLEEMAQASHTAFEIEPELIPIPGVVAKVCAAFGLDPLATMGEGALLLTCTPRAVPDLLRQMSRAKIPTTEIGKVKNGQGLHLMEDGKMGRKYTRRPDGYWGAYARANHLI
jgi:hydrogenase expression/formation protein HypE